MSAPAVRNDLVPPRGVKKALLHCCCACCAGDIIETMLAWGVTPTVFFSNSNIFPEAEYAARRKSAADFAKKKNIDFVDDKYCPQEWALAVKGLENEPEGGRRCEKCFMFRLGKAAEYAAKNGYEIFTSTLGISRFKNFEMITACGKKAAGQYPGLVYWDHNWRKQGGSQRMYETAKKENFYMQNYCGCIYSLHRSQRRGGS